MLKIKLNKKNIGAEIIVNLNEITNKENSNFHYLGKKINWLYGIIDPCFIRQHPSKEIE